MKGIYHRDHGDTERKTEKEDRRERNVVEITSKQDVRNAESQRRRVEEDKIKRIGY